LGDVDFPNFVATLNEVGYRGAGCLEVEDRAFEGSLEDTKAGIGISYRYLHTLMG